MSRVNGPVKRARIFAHLKLLKCEVAFLQETHLMVKDHIRLKKLWVDQIFHSSFNSRSRGAAIIIHKKTLFNATDIISDPHGRFIIVSGSLYHKPVLLVNVYAPNWDDEKFIEKVTSSIPDLNLHSLIFGGDLNCTINTSLERPKV